MTVVLRPLKTADTGLSEGGLRKPPPAVTRSRPPAATRNRDRRRAVSACLIALSSLGTVMATRSQAGQRCHSASFLPNADESPRQRGSKQKARVQRQDARGLSPARGSSHTHVGPSMASEGTSVWGHTDVAMQGPAQVRAGWGGERPLDVGGPASPALRPWLCRHIGNSAPVWPRPEPPGAQAGGPDCVQTGVRAGSCVPAACLRLVIGCSSVPVRSAGLVALCPGSVQSSFCKQRGHFSC